MLHDSSAAQSTSPYVKVSGCIGLYRHTVTGRYYGVKKLHGKKREHSLATTDRKIAERRLREWIANFEKVDCEVEKMTLKQLSQRFIATNQGKSQSSRETIKGVITDFESWWPHGMDFQVRHVRPSHLEEWLAMQERRLRNASYNRVAGVLKQLFELAVRDRIIAESPFERVATPWKKPQTPVRNIPTVAQFGAIVNSVRSQKNNSHAEESADFIEFMGLAGLGQAEAASLTWGDVDFTQNCMRIRRHKTDTRFTVPIYAHMKPLMERLYANPGPKARQTLVFNIKDAKKALTNACERLGLPHFSQRNLRQSLIRRLWQAGVDRKLIAKWQGHQDGGLLIMATYTEVFGSDDAEYERMQLAKLAPPVNVVPLEPASMDAHTAANAA